MPTEPLCWGILGVAKINDRLLPAFKAAENTSLIAIASRDAAKAKAAAFAAGIPTAYGSYEALLADRAVDAVYIPLPNTLHAEWTRRAADAGKHVLCEKPLTPTAEEAAQLVAYCRAKGVRLMDGFMWPHHARTARLRRLLDDGAIGAVRHVAAAFTFQLPLDPQNIRLQPAMAGGSLLDVGCYPVYGIRWAFGAEPERVYATAKTPHAPVAGDHRHDRGHPRAGNVGAAQAGRLHPRARRPRAGARGDPGPGPDRVHARRLRQDRAGGARTGAVAG
jgi:predicted dehydrogenase